MKRRSFLSSILAAGFAPAAVGSGVLMPVKQIIAPMSLAEWDAAQMDIAWHRVTTAIDQFGERGHLVPYIARRRDRLPDGSLGHWYDVHGYAGKTPSGIVFFTGKEAA